MSGQENMDFDRETFRQVEQGLQPPTLRFFLFKEPTVTFGRLQKLESLRTKIPQGWPAVQRPTGGGLVLHQNDLCLSLCWAHGQSPMPMHVQDQYRWIHSVIQAALKDVLPLEMAACGDCAEPTQAFEDRECFVQPVGYDLINGKKKRVGGALYHSKQASLYQGSIQWPAVPLEPLRTAFQTAWAKA